MVSSTTSPCVAAYTHTVLETITRPASARRAASSTRATPSVLSATLSAGSATMSFTSAMAARWKTACAFFSASVTESWSSMSTSAHSTFGCSGGFGSMTRTS